MEDDDRAMFEFDILAMLNARLGEIGSCPNRVEKLESKVLFDVKHDLIDILVDVICKNVSSDGK